MRTVPCTSRASAGSAASIRCSAVAIALRTETRARSPSGLNRRGRPPSPVAAATIVVPSTEATFPVIGLVYLPVALLSGVLGPFPWEPGWLGCCATCPPSRWWTR